jgi:hypothetical protein
MEATLSEAGHVTELGEASGVHAQPASRLLPDGQGAASLGLSEGDVRLTSDRRPE